MIFIQITSTATLDFAKPFSQNQQHLTKFVNTIQALSRYPLSAIRYPLSVVSA